MLEKSGLEEERARWPYRSSKPAWRALRPPEGSTPSPLRQRTTDSADNADDRPGAVGAGMRVPGSAQHWTSFEMRANTQNFVGVALDSEIETPGSSYPRLPDILRLIKFLGPERRVAEVAEEKPHLLFKRALNGKWRRSELSDDFRSIERSHAPWFSRAWCALVRSAQPPGAFVSARALPGHATPGPPASRRKDRRPGRL